MQRRVGILQSNYIPWKGYFDLIGMVDVFVFYDDIQFTKNDWRNRNRVKTGQGLRWLTVPCGTSTKRLICEVAPTGPNWQKKHWRLLCQEYGKAAHFEEFRAFFEDVYLHRRWTNLSDLNQHLIRTIARDFLALQTRFDDSRRYGLSGRGGDRVIDLLKKLGATDYLSGPAGRNYLESEAFAQEKIGLDWMDYAGYPEYRQFHPPFVHEVSIVDLLFHEGSHAREFLKCTGGAVRES